MLSSRTTREVLEDHLRLRMEGKLEEDLKRNYPEDIVFLTVEKVYKGYDGVRESAALLKCYVPVGSYTYDIVRVHGEMGYLVWNATSEKNDIKYGADSYLIQEGKIRVQTIYYHVSRKK